MRFDHLRSGTLSTPKLLLAAGLLAGAGLAAPVMAQNALGDGRGLEANTRVGSGGRNYQRPSLEREVQFRNSIATGNAPGGVSFRGDLGYQAPGEFSGSLGSDTLYSFRRDSLYSGLAGMGIRGTDAIQYQFSMTTGSRVTSSLIGNLSVSRLGGASSASLRGGIGDSGDAIAIDPLSGLLGGSDAPGGALRASLSAAPNANLATGTLRSTSSYSANAGLTPELMTTFQQGIEKIPYGMVASPLMGLVATPMDMAGRREDPGSSKDRVTPIKTSYDDVVEAMRERAKLLRERSMPIEGSEQQPQDPAENPGDAPVKTEDQLTNDWIGDRLRTLQRNVMGIPEENSSQNSAQGAEQASGSTADPSDPASTPIRGVEIRDPVNPYPDGKGIEGGAPKVSFEQDGSKIANQRTGYTIDPDTLELIRGNGNRVTYLVDPTAETKNFYDVHMVAGEGLLKAGRYFDAEERFAQALSIRTGDVSAQLGRMHAQIGAGLVMSASINLQTMMTEHLEIVSRRYSGGLLPSEERVGELIMNLRERSGLEERPSYLVPEPARVRVACGMLIAYLGFQINDEQQMQEGFEVMREYGSSSEQRLVILLDTIWGAVMHAPAQDSMNSPKTSDPWDMREPNP